VTSNLVYISVISLWSVLLVEDKGNNKITELRAILRRESQNSYEYKQTKSVNNRKTVKTVMTLKFDYLTIEQTKAEGDDKYQKSS
jgi:hypothetical protein